ncbi:MAG: bacterial Ig-like domain-containing protein [Clostridia bacterium]|nr:bacterial Ig-like domain-containing protein [Clostridia bacterium]
MRKTSKLLSLLLAVVMMLSAFAVNSFAVATELAAGSSKETATNIPQYGVEYVSTLNKAGEVDWFKFTTLEEDAYYTFYLQNYNIYENPSGEKWCLNLYLFDVYSKQLIRIESTSNTNIKLEKNTTYYIRVNMGSSVNDSTGNYAFKITYKLDPISNVKAEATEINVNTLYKYSLDGTSDVDWYKFTAPVDGKYKVTLENYNIYENPSGERWVLNLYVFDVYSKLLANQQSAGSKEIVLEKDESYYIKINVGESIKTSTGNYGFKIQCDGVPDEPGTPDAPATKTLSGITVSSLPDKQTYSVGEDFDSTGLVVKANYSDGTSKTVTDYTLDSFDSTTEGTKTVTVSYTEGGVTKTCTFDVTVNESGSNTGFFLFDWFIAFIDFIVMIFSFLF